MALALQKQIEEQIEEQASRTDSLEMILGQFMVSTHKSISRLERCMERLEHSLGEFKDETERDRKRMNKQWGDLANKMGTLVEDIVAPNIGGIAKRYFNVEDLEFFGIRIKKANMKNKSVKKEFDIIAVSDEYFIVNETKSTPRPEYARDFMETLHEIKDYFPEYSHKQLIPVFSSLYIPLDIQTYLSKHGIYAMGMKDETMDILNFEEIRLKS